jgi:hypothetical protein
VFPDKPDENRRSHEGCIDRYKISDTHSVNYNTNSRNIA